MGPSLGGERTLTETNALANGTPQSVSVTAPLSGMPSGTYNLWLTADDGRSPPVKLYAPQPITIAPRAFAATWNPTITPAASLRRIDLAWTAHPDPDAREYAVEVSGPSFGETTVYTVGQQLSLSLANLTPSETYTFTLLARNEALGQTARSAAVTAVPLNAPLTLSAPAGTSYATEFGQTFTAMLVLRTPLTHYPEGAGISVDVPDGLVVELPGGLFTPTAAGTQVPVTIRAVRDIPGSTYTLPIQLQGVGATSQITLSVIVAGKTLTVARAGAGSGSVTSAAEGIDLLLASSRYWKRLALTMPPHLRCT